MDNKSKSMGHLAKWVLIFSGGITGYDMGYEARIPSDTEVQEECIAPSELEIRCEDLTGDKKPETIIQIKDKEYILRRIEGMPVLSPYEVIESSSKINYKD